MDDKNIDEIDFSEGSQRTIQPPDENSPGSFELKGEDGKAQDAASHQCQRPMWKIKTVAGDEESLELGGIRERIKKGEIGPDTLVSGPKFKGWESLSKVPQLSRFFEFQSSIKSMPSPRGGAKNPPADAGGAGESGGGGSKGKWIVIVALLLLAVLFIFNPGGRVRFWHKGGIRDADIDDIFGEIEEFIEWEEEPAVKEIPLEESGFEPGRRDSFEIAVPVEESVREAPDIFAGEIFALGLEKTEEEKRAEQIERLLLRGKEAIETGSFADAANIFTQILKLDPGHQEATNNMFLALSNLRESEAKANLGRRISAHFDRARLFYEEKAYEESLKEFEKVLELDPSHVIAEEFARRITDRLSGEEKRRLEEKRKKDEEARLRAEEERQKKLEEMRANIPGIEREIETHFREKEYERVVQKAAELLSIDPSNRTAIGLFSRAKEILGQDDERVARALSESEVRKRMLEVDKASVPTISEPGITTEKEGAERKLLKDDEFVSPETRKLKEMAERARQRVSLDFKDADLRDVIRFLVEQTQVNIVIDESVLREISEPAAPSQPLTVPAFQSPFEEQPDAAGQALSAGYAAPMPQQTQLYSQPVEGSSGAISPKVTIYLVNVPLETALHAVLRAKGLTYKIEEDIIWISTRERLEHEDMVVKVFTLKNALGRFTNFPSSGLSGGTAGGGKDRGGFSIFGSPAGRETSAEDRWLREIGLIEDEQTEQREADIRDIIMQFVPQPDGSAIAYYEKVNKLIVRNTPANVELVARVIESLDISAYQVAIEARIVEISSFDGVDFGVNLEDILYEKGDRYARNRIGGSITHGSAPFGELGHPSGGLELIYSTINDLQYKAIINALSRSKNANTLSAPQLTCLDNQTANIRVARNYKYVSRWEYDTAGFDEYLREFWTPVIDELDDGIILEVTPHVNDENMTITLVVKPTVNELVEFVLVGDKDHPTQLPVTIRRSLETTVSLKNGHTLVMGGLMKNEESSYTRKVPLLGDVPVLGNLFRAETTYGNKVNMLIFIKATVIDSEGRIVQEKMDTMGLEM